MRSILAGLLFILVVPVLCSAQVGGFVESVGFSNYYRPGCWTQMVVTLAPETGENALYHLQVKQEDLDRDQQIFTKSISVTGNPEGGSVRQQKFRIYFKPKPTDGGLPDANIVGTNLSDLRSALRVSITTVGGKLVNDLPINATIASVEKQGNGYTSVNGTRFVLLVSSGQDLPAWKDYLQSAGQLEDAVMVTVQPYDLPESVLGYDGVDAIVWLGADPSELKSGGDDKYRALESYVRTGGKLVITQPKDWQKTLAFGELLPVNILGIDTKNDLSPLAEMAKAKSSNLYDRKNQIDYSDPWSTYKGSLNVARAAAKTGAVVDQWVQWDKDGKDRTPFLVRKVFGVGGVTWVGAELGDAGLTRSIKRGWPNIWDKVLDWHNDLIPTIDPPLLQVEAYKGAPGVDIGGSFIGGMEFGSKSAWLITLAILFFIAYWLVAGPGVFVVLLARKRAELNWFLFGASAVAATLLTILLVRLVLRGPPEMRHISFVRTAPLVPAVVDSHMGVYIPHDGPQRLELKNAAPGTVSTLTAFAIHPKYLDPSSVSEWQGAEYAVPVRDATSQEPAAVDVPFRSTLKKLEATWSGTITGTIDGSAKLIENRYIEGTLTNGTGVLLRNVYIAFKYRLGDAATTDDWMLYLRDWQPGASIDLTKAFNQTVDAQGVQKRVPTVGIDGHSPSDSPVIRGRLLLDWQPYWLGRLRRGVSAVGGETANDSGDAIPSSVPMMSFFDRLAPDKTTLQTQRVELLRRGIRRYDLSAALGAGGLVVVAEGAGPLPIPAEVRGDPLTGEGKIIYQAVLPLENSLLAKPPGE